MYYVRPPAEKPCLIVPGRGLPERHEPEAVVLDLMRPAGAARHCRAGDGAQGWMSARDRRFVSRLA